MVTFQVLSLKHFVHGVELIFNGVFWVPKLVYCGIIPVKKKQLLSFLLKYKLVEKTSFFIFSNSDFY